MSTAYTAAGAFALGWVLTEVARRVLRLMGGESAHVWRPHGSILNGRGLVCSVFVGGQLDTVVRIPAWSFGLSPAPNTYPPTRVFFWASGARRRLDEGDMIWARFVVFPLKPLRLRWITNNNPSAAWTGRERELLAVEWWTPRGWRARHVWRP